MVHALCFNCARAWAPGDGFSDVVPGFGIVEELLDAEIEARGKARDLEAMPQKALSCPEVYRRILSPANTERPCAR